MSVRQGWYGTLLLGLLLVWPTVAKAVDGDIKLTKIYPEVLPAAQPPKGDELLPLPRADKADSKTEDKPEPKPGDDKVLKPEDLKSGQEESGSVKPMLSVRQDFGDGVGFENGFTYIEGFIPLFQNTNTSVLFLDTRAVNFLDGSKWEFNNGGGMRVYRQDLGYIFGVNGFYDGRHTDTHWFNQLGAGFEALGEILDFRGNVYFPIGPQHRDLGFSDPHFRAHDILLDHNFEIALWGFDTEVGVPVPGLGLFDPRVFVGYYHYENSGIKTVNGIRGRFEAWLGDRMSLHAAIQNDALFGTTVSGGFAIHLGGAPSRRRERRALPDRMGDRVVRDVDIVVAQGSREEQAIDPATGQPFHVCHVNSNTPTGGDGTFEHPFQTLGDVQTNCLPRDIIFAHANSVFNAQSITLKDNQRFLGEGVPHLFTATQGTFFLPRATNGTALPIIQNSPGDAVTLANNNEVSGFQIANAGANGISGIGLPLTTFNINNNIITNPAQNGIFLTNVGGSGTIANNTITGSGHSAVNLDTNVSLNLGFTGNIMSGSGSTFDVAGLFFRGVSQSNLQISGNTIVNASSGNSGLTLQTFDTAKVVASISGNNLSNNALNGLNTTSHNNSLLIATITGNTIANNTLFGILTTSLDSSHSTLTISGNTVSGGFDGLLCQSAGTSRLGLTLTSNSFANQTTNAIDVESNASSTLVALVTGNSVTGTPSRGFLASSLGSSLLCLGLHNNASTGTIDAYRLDAGGGTTFQLEAGATTDNVGTPFTMTGTFTTVPQGFCQP